MESNRKVAYFYEPEIGNHYYGHGHPMKPHRVRMAHTLIVRYGLYRHLDVFQTVRASERAMSAFHDPDYIDFLQNVSYGLRRHRGLLSEGLRSCLSTVCKTQPNSALDFVFTPD